MTESPSSFASFPRSAEDRQKLGAYNAYYFIDANGILQLWDDEWEYILSFDAKEYSAVDIMRTLHIAYRIHLAGVTRGIEIGKRQIRDQLHAALGAPREIGSMQQRMTNLESNR
jgi:hypothetical protein